MMYDADQVRVTTNACARVVCVWVCSILVTNERILFLVTNERILFLVTNARILFLVF